MQIALRRALAAFLEDRFEIALQLALLPRQALGTTVLGIAGALALAERFIQQHALLAHHFAQVAQGLVAGRGRGSARAIGDLQILNQPLQQREQLHRLELISALRKFLDGLEQGGEILGAEDLHVWTLRRVVLRRVLSQRLKIALQQILIAFEQRINLALRRALGHRLGQGLLHLAQLFGHGQDAALLQRHRRLPQQVLDASDVLPVLGVVQTPIGGAQRQIGAQRAGVELVRRQCQRAQRAQRSSARPKARTGEILTLFDQRAG